MNENIVANPLDTPYQITELELRLFGRYFVEQWIRIIHHMDWNYDSDFVYKRQPMLGGEIEMAQESVNSQIKIADRIGYITLYELYKEVYKGTNISRDRYVFPTFLTERDDIQQVLYEEMKANMSDDDSDE